jgi:hypothetical protein
MAATSNYGSTITKGGTTVGKCMVTDYPEIATGKANATHHGSGGWAESIPTGLITVGDVTISLILEEGTLPGILADIVAKSIEPIVITNGVDTMTFDGYYISAKPEAADATAPDVYKASVVIGTTGDIVLS